MKNKFHINIEATGKSVGVKEYGKECVVRFHHYGGAFPIEYLGVLIPEEMAKLIEELKAKAGKNLHTKFYYVFSKNDKGEGIYKETTQYDRP